MPELPEVQTIADQLSEYLPLSISEVETSIHANTFIKKSDFELGPCDIQRIYRLGKSLIMDLSLGTLVSGLGMSGGWRISKEDRGVKHTHFKFKVKNKNGEIFYLSYVDPRRFGRMMLFNEMSFKVFKDSLPPDPTSEDFNEEYLRTVFKRFPQRQIKPFLLDQKYFAGIGNYMACEICALAGVRPTRRAGKITKKEIEKFVSGTKMVIEGSVKNNGLTFSGGYFDANGEKGEGVLNLLVFHQKSCGMCKKENIKKIVLATRGTYYCPHCQR